MYVSLELAHSMVDWATMAIAGGDREVGGRRRRPGRAPGRPGRRATSARRRSSCTAASAMTAEYAVGVGTAHLTVLDQRLGNGRHHLHAARRPRHRARAGRTRSDGPLADRGAAGLPRPRPRLPRARGRPAPDAVGPRRVGRPRDRAEDGRAGLLRADHPRGVRRRRGRLRHLLARHGGARPGRLRAARHRVGQQRAGRQVDPRSTAPRSRSRSGCPSSPPPPRSAASG